MNPMFTRVVGIVGLSLLAVVGMVLARRFISPAELKENNEFAGFTYAFIGAVYGVYLAFTVVVVWEQFAKADEIATAEAVHLSEAWRDIQALPQDVRVPVENQMIAYAESVITREWPSMADRKGAHTETARVYEDLWRSLYKARPTSASSPGEVSFFTEAVTQMNQLGMERRLRLLSAETSLPEIMWELLIGGGLMTILFTYMIGARHAWVQAVMTFILTVILVSALTLVNALNHAYAGEVAVKPDAMESVLTSLKRRQAENRTLEPRLNNAATSPAPAAREEGVPVSRH